MLQEALQQMKALIKSRIKGGWALAADEKAIVPMLHVNRGWPGTPRLSDHVSFRGVVM